MTDTTNHAEVIREALEHFKRNAFDGYGYEMPGPAGQALDALDALTRELDGAKFNLGNILAVIHRDGGHYQGEHGGKKATDDAISAWANLMTDIDAAHATIAAQSARIATLEEALRPWGSGGIITGTVLAWIAAKDASIAKAIVYGKATVDRALAPKEAQG